jgi:NitT/TauT family transport system substrate-binding protein
MKSLALTGLSGVPSRHHPGQGRPGLRGEIMWRRSLFRRSPAPLALTMSALLASITLAACGSSDTESNPGESTGPRKVSVGIIPIIDVAPLYLGIKQGFFSKRGLDVSATPAQGGAAIVPAVLAGENQIGFSNVVSLLIAKEKKIPIVSIAGGASSTGDAAKDVNAVLVGKNSTLKTAADLAGKKVAINSLNNLGDTTIKTAVEKAGGDPSKVTFVEMPFPDMPAQLAAGKVDAVWESEPFRSQIIGDGGRILFDNLTETHPALQIAQWFTSTKLQQEDPKLVKDFVDGINESMAYASANPDAARDILSTYTKVSPPVAKVVVLPKWSPGLDEESAKVVGDAALKYGTLSKEPDVSGLFGK